MFEQQCPPQEPPSLWSGVISPPLIINYATSRQKLNCTAVDTQGIILLITGHSTAQFCFDLCPFFGACCGQNHEKKRRLWNCEKKSSETRERFRGLENSLKAGGLISPRYQPLIADLVTISSTAFSFCIFFAGLA
jgi:hypothetical protein